MLREHIWETIVLFEENYCSLWREVLFKENYCSLWREQVLFEENYCSLQREQVLFEENYCSITWLFLIPCSNPSVMGGICVSLVIVHASSTFFLCHVSFIVCMFHFQTGHIWCIQQILSEVSRRAVTMGASYKHQVQWWVEEEAIRPHRVDGSGDVICQMSIWAAAAEHSHFILSVTHVQPLHEHDERPAPPKLFLGVRALWPYFDQRGDGQQRCMISWSFSFDWLIGLILVCH